MSNKIDNDNDKSSLIRSWLYSIYNDEQTKTKHIWSMVVAGGGNSSLKDVFNQPGASASLRSALIPYSLDSFPTYTNKSINGCVNIDTANILGETSYAKTVESLLKEESLSKDKHNISDILNSNIFSIACTATLRSLTPKRGDHRFIVSSVSNIDTFIYEFTIDKTEDLSRVQEDELTSDTIFLAIGDRSKKPYELLSNKYNPKKTVIIRDDPFKNLYDSKIKKVLCFSKDINGLTFDNRFNCFEDINLPENTLVFPGTFNPIHNGHIELVKVALIKLGWDITKPNPLIVFDIGCNNADKGFKSIDEIKKIIDQNVIILKDSGITNFAFSVSSVSLYSDKSYIYKNCYILQGSDTFERVLNTKYYEHSEYKLIFSLTEIFMNGCKLIIGGRLSSPSDSTILISDKKFITASSIINEKGKNIPAKILDTYIELSEEDFRVDLSSSEIKLKGK